MVPREMGLLTTADRTQHESTPLGRALVFWLGMFMVVWQAERLYLLPEIASAEGPTPSLAVVTLLRGLGNDVVAGVAMMGVGLVVAFLPTCLTFVRQDTAPGRMWSDRWRRFVSIVCLSLTVLLLCFSTADLCYYAYNHKHVDFVFFEFVGDLVQGASVGSSSQAAEQTGAELGDAGKWIWRIGGYWGVVALLSGAWMVVQRYMNAIFARQWKRMSLMAALGLTFPLAVGVSGDTPAAHYIGRDFRMPSEAYYDLSQNPVLSSVIPMRHAFVSQWKWTASTLPVPMTTAEAIDLAKRTVGKDDVFPRTDFPLVRAQQADISPFFGRRVNVLLIFVEALDRRYLDQVRTVEEINESGKRSVHSIRVTPFLDGLKNDSLYFSHFFSNGVQTSRGLLSTLCSVFPRQGTAAIKTRYKYDYLCFPKVLQRAGYRTETVVSLDVDLPGLPQFLERNGIDRYYGEKDFPSNAERLGVGLTDQALFDFVSARLDQLQSSGQPFFLATLSAGTHHPFAVPTDHADVRHLLHDPDPYWAALRYCDWTIEKLFTSLRSRNLLKDTMVIIMGDHGRHEAVGRTDTERQIGHFLAPMYIWLDDSLRTSPANYPKIVTGIASQVDIAPTVLAVNGMTPNLVPFVGQSLVCLLKSDCLEANQAYLSSMYDDLIGIASPSGLWTYSFRRNLLTAVDLDLQRPAVHPPIGGAQAEHYVRVMTGLYLASNTLLEQNRIWSHHVLSPDS